MAMSMYILYKAIWLLSCTLPIANMAIIVYNKTINKGSETRTCFTEWKDNIPVTEPRPRIVRKITFPLP